MFLLDPYDPNDGSFPGLIPIPPLLRRTLFDEDSPSTNVPYEALRLSLGISGALLVFFIEV